MPISAALHKDLAASLERVAAGGHGSITFVSGPAGSGRSDLLRCLAASLGNRADCLVIGSRLAGADSQPGEKAEAMSNSGGRLAREVLKLGLELVPGLPVLGQALEVMEAGRAVAIEHSSSRRQPARSGLDLARSLRERTREAPVIALLDDLDADQSGAVQMAVSCLAHELRTSGTPMPLAVVATVRGSSPNQQASMSPTVEFLQAHARSARWETVGDLCNQDLECWLGTADESLVSALMGVSGGGRRWAGMVFDAWVHADAAMQREGRWRMSGPTPDLAPVHELVANRLRQWSQLTPAEMSQAMDLLACGALEGETFTAEALAIATERDPNVVVDSLDDRAEEGAGESILEEVSPFLPTRSPRPLWRYRFRSTFVRESLLRIRLSSSERRELASAYRSALSQLMAKERLEAAQELACLSRFAGDPSAADEILGDRDRQMVVAQTVRRAIEIADGPARKESLGESSAAIEQLFSGAMELQLAADSSVFLRSAPTCHGRTFGPPQAHNCRYP